MMCAFSTLFAWQIEQNKIWQSSFTILFVRARLPWGQKGGTCFNLLPSCRLTAITEGDLNRWQHSGLNYKLSLAGLLFPLFISTVSPNETPLQAISSGLIPVKLIMWTQPGCSLTHRPTTESLDLELLRHTQSILKWKGVIPRAPHPCTSWPLTPVNTGHYFDNNCIRFFTERSKTASPWTHLLARALIRYCWFMYLAKLPYWPCSLTFY